MRVLQFSPLDLRDLRRLRCPTGVLSAPLVFLRCPWRFCGATQTQERSRCNLTVVDCVILLRCLELTVRLRYPVNRYPHPTTLPSPASREREILRERTG